MSKKYRAAVVGCGMGGGIHLRAYRESDRFDLVAVCDLRMEVLEEQKKEQPELHACVDYEAMLGKEELDFLSVATLPPTHETIVRAGVEAGVKAVLCEKPIGHDAFSGRRIIEVCEQADVALVVTHQFRTLPHALAVRKLVADGAIGEPYLCEMRFEGWDLINAGIHIINAISFILGDPPVAHVMGQMDCSTRVVRDGMQVETVGVTHFTYENGMRCILETGDGVIFPPNRPNDMTLYGSMGRIEFGLWQNDVTLWNADHPDGLRQTPTAAEGQVLGHRAYAEGLIEQIESGSFNYDLARAGQAAMEVVFASYLSSCHGERIAVPVADDLRLNPSRAWAGLPARGELPE